MDGATADATGGCDGVLEGILSLMVNGTWQYWFKVKD